MRKPAARQGGPGLTDAAMARGDAANRLSPVERFVQVRFLRALRRCGEKPVGCTDTLATPAALLPA